MLTRRSGHHSSTTATTLVRFSWAADTQIRNLRQLVQSLQNGFVVLRPEGTRQPTVNGATHGDIGENPKLATGRRALRMWTMRSESVRSPVWVRRLAPIPRGPGLSRCV
jgi:hypothetical protein